MTAWINRNGIVTATPSPREPIVLTFIEGRIAAVDRSENYEAVRTRAYEFAQSHRLGVKVLPVNFAEGLNFLRISREEFRAHFSEDEWRELEADVIQTLKRALREENDPETRREAYDLLVAMGEIEP